MKRLTQFFVNFLTAAGTVTVITAVCHSNMNTAKADNQNLYPLTAIVTEINNTSVTVTAQNGNTFQFENTGINGEFWMYGDICSLIMPDNGTIYVKDDEVIKTQYSGFLSDEEIKQWIK